MNTLARPVKRRPFEMETQHTGNHQAGLSNSSQLLNHLNSIGDECRQAARGPRFAVRLDDASYAGLRRLVIEKNAAAPIYLDVYESRREDRIRRKADRCARVELAEADALNTTIRNPD